MKNYDEEPDSRLDNVHVQYEREAPNELDLIHAQRNYILNGLQDMSDACEESHHEQCSHLLHDICQCACHKQPVEAIEEPKVVVPRNVVTGTRNGQQEPITSIMSYDLPSQVERELNIILNRRDYEEIVVEHPIDSEREVYTRMDNRRGYWLKRYRRAGAAWALYKGSRVFPTANGTTWGGTRKNSGGGKGAGKGKGPEYEQGYQAGYKAGTRQQYVLDVATISLTADERQALLDEGFVQIDDETVRYQTGVRARDKCLLEALAEHLTRELGYDHPERVVLTDIRPAPLTAEERAETE